MADLNALIAQGAQFRQPESPLNMMAQLQTFQQGQSTNQLNQMKIAEAQRGMEEANALRRLDPSSASYLQDVMRVSPEKGFAFAKSQQEAKAAGTESQIKNVKLLTDTLATIPEMYKRANTPEDFLAIHQSVHSNPVLGPWLKSIGATPDKGLATLQTAAQTPGGLEQYRQQAMSSVAQILESAKPIIVSPSASVYSGGKFTQAPAAPVTPKQTDLQLNYQAAKDQGFVGSIFDYEKKLKEAGRAPATPATPSAPVAVIDPVTGNQVFVSREEALRNRMTPAAGAGASKPMTKLQEQAYRKDFANDTSKIKSATDTADELEKLTDELVGNPVKGVKPHPGLGGITGYTGMLPSLPTGEAAKAEQKLETFKGKIKALGRAIASQEGKLGNMVVQEWQMVSDAVQAIKPTAGNLDEQMRDVVRQARVLSKNMQDKFDLTYEGGAPAAGAAAPAAAAPAAAAPAAGGKLSPAEQTELDALRKRFGK